MSKSKLSANIITGVKDKCRECGACIRVCPVKAIKIAEGQVEIIDERCVHCGQCLNVCAPQAISLRHDINSVKDLLANNQVVAIIAPEMSSSFPGLEIAQIEILLRKIGFFAIEESVLGEELVAREYLAHVRNGADQPIIRSTCQAIVAMIEKFHPELIPFLAPIASPMVAQGRMIKSLYGNDVKTVFIGPCVAKKMEAVCFSDQPVDAVLTFGELKSLVGDFDKAELLKQSKDSPFNERPLLARTLSVSEGFPREILAGQSVIDNSLVVEWGVRRARQIMSRLSSPLEMNAQLFDLMGCRGCIDGPAMETEIELVERKQLAFKYYQKRLPNSVLFEQLRPSLPDISLSRRFSSQKISDLVPTTEEVRAILNEGGKETVTDELNCGSCGYNSCREKAVAIYQGLADWTMCFPRQKQLFIQSTSQLREISVTDGLTGLINQRAFLEKLKEEFNRVHRYQSLMSLIMVDVDRFKAINDTHGHLEGDRILKLLADLFRHHLRETDIAARYGGDEFAFILPQTNKTEAFAVSEKLRSLVEDTIFFIGEEQGEIVEHVTLSLGVCDMNLEDTDPIEVISRADKAMYEAKKSGRNKTVIAG